ncbi:Hypothetical_protein [Hexamita inflata]|uniref:Hypothetical_protein n=1 Tax=Hexamita inflata TaxID=28002 RepID=A0ABP1HJL3_9EUKA
MDASLGASDISLRNINSVDTAIKGLSNFILVEVIYEQFEINTNIQQERLNMQLTQLNSQSASAYSKCYEIVCTESCLTCYRQRSQQFRQTRTQLRVDGIYRRPWLINFHSIVGKQTLQQGHCYKKRQKQLEIDKFGKDDCQKQQIWVPKQQRKGMTSNIINLLQPQTALYEKMSTCYYL